MYIFTVRLFEEWWRNRFEAIDFSDKLYGALYMLPNITYLPAFFLNWSIVTKATKPHNSIF